MYTNAKRFPWKICGLLLLLLSGALLGGCGVRPVFSQAPLWARSSSPEAAESTPVFSPSAAPSPTPAAKPSPTAPPTPTPVPTPFTVAWFSDTQAMSQFDSLSPAAASMFQWVRLNRKEQNIQLVIHTGDVVENGFNPEYWERIEPELKMLAAELPFLAAAGNHDIGRDRNDYSEFLARDYLAGIQPDHRYEGGKGSWIAFHAGGRDFIAVSLGYGCYDEAGLGWMRRVFEDHPGSVGIIAVHEYMGYQSRMSKAGMLVQSAVVAQCPNIRLVLCGHIRSTGRRQDAFDDDGDGQPDRIVNAMVYNYQQVRSLKDSGYFRILAFDPLTGSISVATYCPYRNDYICMGSKSDAQEFVLYDAF